MLHFLGTFSLSSFLLLPANTSQQILGQWESVDRSPGGVGEIVEFRADGSLVQLSAAMGDASYKVEGNWLITFWKDRVTGKISEIVNAIEFEGNDLVEKDEQGNLVTRMERMERGMAHDSPLVGKWCSDTSPGLTTLREFTKDGKMFIRLPMVPTHGRYAISGDVLTVEVGQSTRKTFQFRIDNDFLTIVPKEGSEKKFKRVETTLLKSRS